MRPLSLTERVARSGTLHSEGGQMNPPPKETDALLHAPKAAAQLLPRLHGLVLFQAGGARVRRCVACNCRVTNDNLGGYDGRSASRRSLLSSMRGRPGRWA